MVLKGFETVKRLYFIGIGGVSMSALAKLFSLRGYSVSGSDEFSNENTENLAFYGVKAYRGKDENREDIANADIVVYTDAIPPAHPEFRYAIALCKKVYSRGELLQKVCASFKSVAAIGGSHGKTTATSMCAHIFKALNVDFVAHIGGQDSALGNFYYSGTDYLLTEACEYKKNFLKLTPDKALVLNIDKDHMECYQNEADLKACFKQFCGQATTSIACADDKNCEDLGATVTFGVQNPLADYRAIDLRANGERYAFTIEEYGNPLCRIRLKAIGRCNVYNALAAFSLVRSYGFHEKEIKKGLESFTSVKRRFERIGTFHGASVICDYAHHPKEIASSIITAQGICARLLYVVFQPHTYSRTKLLKSEFVETLRKVKNLTIYKTYAARENYDEEGSAERLAEEIGNCLYVDNVYSLKTWLKTTVKEGDTVLCLGAGDIYYAAQYLIKDLK